MPSFRLLPLRRLPVKTAVRLHATPTCPERYVYILSEVDQDGAPRLVKWTAC